MSAQPVIDMHTHLYPPGFGDLMLWGIDELVTSRRTNSPTKISGA